MVYLDKTPDHPTHLHLYQPDRTLSVNFEDFQMQQQLTGSDTNRPNGL